MKLTYIDISLRIIANGSRTFIVKAKVDDREVVSFQGTTLESVGVWLIGLANDIDRGTVRFVEGSQT